MSEEKSGTVKNTTINHYQDCSVDTVIELDDGSTIVYSHVAPIPVGHPVSARGETNSMAKTMVRIHRNYFCLDENEQLRYVFPAMEVGSNSELDFDKDKQVLSAKEVVDKKTGVKYREHY
jgi:hypothetical protein